jgi:hypothetical protein
MVEARKVNLRNSLDRAWLLSWVAMLLAIWWQNTVCAILAVLVMLSLIERRLEELPGWQVKPIVQAVEQNKS